MEKGILKEVKRAVPHFLKMHPRNMWIDYDEGADVLYISFEKPQNASDSELVDDIIIHTRGKKTVGLTIMHASDYST